MEFSIQTNRQEYLPGDTILARIRIKSQNPINARAVYAIVYCHEKKKVMRYITIPPDEIRRIRELGMEVTSTVKQTYALEEMDKHKIEKKVGEKASYQVHVFDVSFELPKNARPTSHIMGHDDRIVIWKIKAKIDIPLAPDMNVEKEIIVSGL